MTVGFSWFPGDSPTNYGSGVVLVIVGDELTHWCICGDGVDNDYKS